MATQFDSVTAPAFESVWSAYGDAPRAPPPEVVLAWARARSDVLVSALRMGNVERYEHEHQAAEKDGSMLFPSEASRIHGILTDACSAALGPTARTPNPMTEEVAAWADAVASRMDLLKGWPRDAFDSAVSESARIFPDYEGANVILFLSMCRARSRLAHSAITK